MKSKMTLMIFFVFMVIIGIAIQSDADETIDLNGEWDAVYSTWMAMIKDTIKISQEGNKFVGIRLNGDVHVPKGSEAIKGELIGEMFRQVFTYDYLGGGQFVWNDAQGVIIENGNKIVIQTLIYDNGLMITVTMTRK